MSKPTPRHASPSKARRGLASAGVLSLALAGGVFAMAGADSASAASATGQYNCKFPGLGLTFNDPWTVTLNADIPDSVDTGASIPAPTITAHIVTGSDAADPLRGQDIVTGTSVADYTVAGEARKANLDVTGLPYTVPATGGVTTDASGKGQAETAPSTPTSVDVVAGDFTAALTLKSGFVANITCTSANAAGIKLGTIKVGSTAPTTTAAPTTTEAPTTTAAPTTTEAPTSTEAPTTTAAPTTTEAPTSTEAPTTTAAPTTTEAPTSTEAPTPTETSTEAPTPTETSTEAPAPTETGTSTAAPVPSGSSTSPSGPIVSTDYVNTNSTAGIAGLTLAAAGFAALGGAVVVGRRNRG